MQSRAEALIEQAWRESSSSGRAPARLELTGDGGRLPSRLAVEETGIACVGVALLAAAELCAQRGAGNRRLRLDRAEVSAALLSERRFRRGGEAAGASFAPLSRFWRAADGWVRTHANYPWHRDALLGALGLAGDDAVPAAIVALPAAEVEDRVFEAGGVAAAVRSPEEWWAHPQGSAVDEEPLVSRRRLGDAPPRSRAAGRLPASGVRVLDLTRAIAGPVCTRFLGALGAEVLRVDPPRFPDLEPGQPADTLLGKRSAILDLESREGQGALQALLDGADVVIHGYRPGALDRFGLDPEQLADLHPGLVSVCLDAWGWSGPWAGRRGFDSIVQAACGIAAIESSDGAEPGALPCQLLDHGTGYLAAAATFDALRDQEARGGSPTRRLSLARTAAWLTSTSPLEEVPAPAADSNPLVDLEWGGGTVSAVPPPGTMDARRLVWPQPVGAYGAASAEWPG